MTPEDGDDGEAGEATLQPTCQCSALQCRAVHYITVQCSTCRRVRNGMVRPKVMLGAVPGDGGTQRLPALTGPTHTYHLSQHKHYLCFRRSNSLDIALTSRLARQDGGHPGAWTMSVSCSCSCACSCTALNCTAALVYRCDGGQ